MSRTTRLHFYFQVSLSLAHNTFAFTARLSQPHLRRYLPVRRVGPGTFRWGWRAAGGARPVRLYTWSRPATRAATADPRRPGRRPRSWRWAELQRFRAPRARAAQTSFVGAPGNAFSTYIWFAETPWNTWTYVTQTSFANHLDICYKDIICRDT